MGPDEKNTGPLAVYIDGQPVGTAYGEIPEISLAEEGPTEAVPPAVISGGSMTITLEQASEAMKSLVGAWGAICTTIEQAGKTLTRVWQAARVALAIRWHMGAYDNAVKGDGRALSAAMEATPWVWRLHQADMCAAWVDEREAEEE